MTQFLKEILEKKPLQIEGNRNNTSTNRQESSRADTSAPRATPLSTTLQGNITDTVVRFDKKLAKKFENYQGKYLHVSLLTMNLFLSVYCTFKTLANYSMEPQGLTGYLQTSHPGHKEQPS